MVQAWEGRRRERDGWRGVLWHSSPDMGCDGIECRCGGRRCGMVVGAGERRKGFGRL